MEKWVLDALLLMFTLAIKPPQKLSLISPPRKNGFADELRHIASVRPGSHFLIK